MTSDADSIYEGSNELAIGESVASQLPGRFGGGVADAYRHILWSAELTRTVGESLAFSILKNHETNPIAGFDNGLDF